MKEEHKLLKILSELDVEIVGNIYKRWSTKMTHKLKEFSQSATSDNPSDVIFISYLDCPNEYDFMAELDIAKTKGHYFILGLPLNEKCPIDIILAKYFSGKLKNLYEVFSGNIIDDNCDYRPLLVNKIMLEGAELVRYHITSGTLDLNNELPIIDVTIPNWCYQIESEFLKGIIGYFEIKNIEVSDKINEKEMRSSAQSRRTFIKACSLVICNYMYKNSFLLISIPFHFLIVFYPIIGTIPFTS